METAVSEQVATMRANERLKLVAAALNNLAVACVVVGYLTPVLHGEVPGGARALLTLAGLVIGAALHAGAHLALRSLR